MALFCLSCDSKHISNCLFSFSSFPPIFPYPNSTNNYRCRKQKDFLWPFFFLIMKKIHRTKTKWPYLNHVELKPYFRLDRRFPWIQVKGPLQQACTNLRREGILLRRQKICVQLKFRGLIVLRKFFCCSKEPLVSFLWLQCVLVFAGLALSPKET